MSPSTDTRLVTYNTVVALQLPKETRARLLLALHEAARRQPPSKRVVRKMVALGPIKTWRQLRTIHGFGRRRQAHLQAALSTPTFSQTLSALLAELTETPAKTPTVEVDFGMTAEEFAALMALARPFKPQRRHHPLGAAVTFPPRVARVLKRGTDPVQGDPCPLPGFPFSEKVVGFREAVRRRPPRRAVVIGAGYIGAEMALAWATTGAQVTLLDRGEALLRGYPPDQVEAVRTLLVDAGVTLRFGVTATGWTRHKSQVIVAARTADAPCTFTANLVLVAVGVQVQGVYWRS